MQNSEWMKNIVKWYYKENFSMTYEGMADGVWMMFSCPNLKNNLCSIYHRRPRICREYPPVDSVFKPDIGPSCGFRLIDRK
jgi:Fe-S-cluster containining protein